MAEKKWTHKRLREKMKEDELLSVYEKFSIFMREHGQTIFSVAGTFSPQITRRRV